MTSVHDQRETLMRILFARGMPRLWCPLLTHYTEDDGLDKKRIGAHIRHFRPWVPAILAPGTVVPAFHALLDRFTGGKTDPAALASRNLCGFTVTLPKRADSAQTLIHDEPGGHSYLS